MIKLIKRMIEFMQQRCFCYGDGTGGPCSPKCERCILLEDLKRELKEEETMSAKLPEMTIQCPSCNSPRHDMEVIYKNGNFIIKCRECGETFRLKCAWNLREYEG